jgi:hypothetical protein
MMNLEKEDHELLSFDGYSSALLVMILLPLYFAFL